MDRTDKRPQRRTQIIAPKAVVPTPTMPPVIRKRLSLANTQPGPPRKELALRRVANTEMPAAHQGMFLLARKYSRSDGCRREK